MPLIDVYLLPGLDGTAKLFERLISVHPAWANPITINYDDAKANSYEYLTELADSRIDSSRKHLIIGESFSGPIAIRIAHSANSKLAGIVLSASFAASPPLAHNIPVPPPLLKAAISMAPHRILAKTLLLNGIEDEALLEAVIAVTKSVPPKVIAERVEAAQRIDVRNEIAELECPVLYLRALHDHVVPAAAWNAIFAANQRAEVTHIDSPHMVLQCRPNEAWNAITQWNEKYS